MQKHISNWEKVQEMMLQFEYPSQNYFDFTDGVNVGDEEINQWISQCIDSVIYDIKNNSIKQTFCFVSSGNTKVIVYAFKK